MGQEVYIVSVNGKVSQEGYSTLEKAQKFVDSRLKNPWVREIVEKTPGWEWTYTVNEDGSQNKIIISVVRIVK